MMKPVVLIDGHSIAYRSYFALIRSPLRNSQGQNTSAVLGFVNTLRRLLARFVPEYAAVVFDAPGRTFRQEQYEQYKAQRPRTPPDLVSQLPIIKRVVAAYGIRQYELSGVEADDVLGTLARNLSEQGHSVCLVSSDKDLLQLITNDVQVYDPYKDVVLDRAATRSRFGVEPEQVRDLLALSGDASDNIPGVPGIGEKKAQALMLKYGTFEAALETEPALQPHREAAQLSRQLATIKTDVAVDLRLAELRIGQPDNQVLLATFKELEFTSLLKELSSSEQKPIEVKDATELSTFSSSPVLAVGLDNGDCYVTDSAKYVVKVPLGDPRLRDMILTNPGITKVGFDLKPVLRKLAQLGIDPVPIADAMVAAWLLDPNRKRIDLEGMMLRYANLLVSTPAPHEIPAYAFELYRQIQSQLEQLKLAELFHSIEMPLTRVLADMEQRGVMLDRDLLADLSCELRQEVTALEERIQMLAGTQFNLNSPRQLSQVLFERLGLKPGRRTKSGYSTDSAVLQELAVSNPIVAEILRLRELSKLVTTYLEPLADLCDPKTGRIHTTFNQTGTATGRLSSSEPNLQNIPIRTELGRRIRQAFIAEPGSVLISADYSQIELRVLAELSGDANLRAAFASGEDIHARTAAALLHVPETDVTVEQRRIAKMVNYGIIYGMSDFGLARRLGLGRDEARAFIQAYFALYPGVRQWCDDAVQQAEQTGHATTLYGRIRPIPELQSKNRAVYEAARRAAINTPVQGTAADLIKLAMIQVHQRLQDARVKGGLVLQIHDELLLEAREEDADQTSKIVHEAMQAAWNRTVALAVEVGIGRNWAAVY